MIAPLLFAEVTHSRGTSVQIWFPIYRSILLQFQRRGFNDRDNQQIKVTAPPQKELVIRPETRERGRLRVRRTTSLAPTSHRLPSCFLTTCGAPDAVSSPRLAPLTLRLDARPTVFRPSVDPCLTRSYEVFVRGRWAHSTQPHATTSYTLPLHRNHTLEPKTNNTQHSSPPDFITHHHGPLSWMMTCIPQTDKFGRFGAPHQQLPPQRACRRRTTFF